MKIKDRAKPKIPPVEAGVYVSVCVGYIDLGEQYSEKFKNYSVKGMFVWELPGEMVEVDGEQKPRQLSKEFTVSSSSKSNLRKFIESLYFLLGEVIFCLSIWKPVRTILRS